MENDILTVQMQLIGIDKYPFSKNELKKVFSKKIHQYHPDKYKGEDAKEKTTALIETYKELIQYADDFDETKDKKIEKESIFDFYKKCDNCSGDGWVMKITRIATSGYNCSKCKDTGIYRVKCNKCDNGKFTLKSGRKVDCRVCKGTGIYEMKCNHYNYFEDWFLGRENYTYKRERVECKKCKGTGQMAYEPVNPVIRKGAILK